MSGVHPRPVCHFTPQRHWINDPNGLVWFDGEYHLFFQHNPFGDQWGHMSWGHAVSTDLLRWTELPVAIAEDERVSIFSGSVVVDIDNRGGFGDGRTPPLVAVYTGCRRRPEGGQAQELAFSNDRGRSWTQYAGNPVLDLGLRDFRDPKVFWHAASRAWVMVVVLPDDRAAQFWQSADLKRWHLVGRFEAALDGQGIWECPDLIELPVDGGGTRWLFKVDTLAGHPSGGSGARVFVGHFDGTSFLPDPATPWTWADWGSDFYAALSWAHLPDDRALWLAWMSCHRYAKDLPALPWRGQMSLPRELRLRRQGGAWQLLQCPVRELLAWRRDAFTQPAQRVSSGVVALGIGGLRTADLSLQLQATTAVRCGWRLQTGPGEWLDLGWDPAAGAVFVDRTCAGFVPPGDPHFAGRRRAPGVAPTAQQPLRLRVLLDAGSVELFVGDGEAVITELLLPRGDSASLAVFSDGGASDFGPLQGWRLAR